MRRALSFLVMVGVVTLAISACDNKKKNKDTTAVAPTNGQEQCIYNSTTGQYTSNVTGQICNQNQNWYNNVNWNQGGYWNGTGNPIYPYPYQYVNYQYVGMGCPYGYMPVYDGYYTYSYYCAEPNYYYSGGFDWWLQFNLRLRF